MIQTLRVALVGGGKMAAQHAAAIRRCTGVRLVAVVDPAVEANELRSIFGSDVATYSDVAIMLSESRPDVAHIVTPPGTHAALARASLEAGVHVYVEKPFALSVADAESVIALAMAKGLKVCAAHQVLFQDSAQDCLRYVPMIGDVEYVESFFSFKPVRRRSGGGGLSTPVDQLIDILPHPVYLLLSALPKGGHPELVALDVSPAGEVRALVRSGDCTACLIVSLRARPVESYLRLMGSNGSIEADFVIGHVVRLLGPGASAPAVVLKPFSRAWQIAWGSFRSLLQLLFRRHKSYPGLAELLTRFYANIVDAGPSPVAAHEIIETVRLCESISARLRAAEAEAEQRATEALRTSEAALHGRMPVLGTVLLTGGTGALGRHVAIELRDAGWQVRVPVRRDLPASQRLPGVTYVRADLGDGVDVALLSGVDCVVHAAAETAGQKADHERNTIQATRNLLDAMVRNGVRRLVNISSVAVLQPSSFGHPLHEDSPVDADSLARGPYVWAKATAECDAAARAVKGEIELRTIRLGPLVDFHAYTAPGRLGREVARLFVGMGRRSGHLSVCSMATASSVIRSYVENFDMAPTYVNLVDVPDPTRGDLADRLKEKRPDLLFLWLPMPVLKALSVCAKLGLQVLRPKSPPVDLYAAFKSESYGRSVAERVIAAASVRSTPRRS